MLDGGRLDELFFQIKLHDGDAADKLPTESAAARGYPAGAFLPEYHRTFPDPRFFCRCVRVFAESLKPWSAHPYWRFARFSDVDAELKGDGRARDAGPLLFELLLGFLPDGRGKISVMDIEDIFLPASFGNLAQGSGDILRFFARVGENDAFFILNAVIKVLVPASMSIRFSGYSAGEESRSFVFSVLYRSVRVRDAICFFPRRTAEFGYFFPNGR